MTAFVDISNANPLNLATQLAPMFAELYGTYKLIPQNMQAGTYTAVLADAGGHIAAGGNVTIPNGVFPRDAWFWVYNNTSGSISVVQGSGLTIALAGTLTTGTRSLAARGLCRVLFVTANACVVDGPGLT